MCGLTGFLAVASARSRSTMETNVARMTKTLVHRGPDDQGSWVDPEAGIAFGFRRLSILDLSPTGHQPMFSSSQRYVLVFNGEVYNFRVLRKELERSSATPPFRGTSDTEVVLAALEAWGVDNALRRFVGMFAIALWDRRDRILHLARDRAGIKPLYWGSAGSSIVFGSELKALVEHPDFVRRVDRNALALYFRYGCVPAPFAIFEGVEKLRPGEHVTIKSGERPVVTSFAAPGEMLEKAIAEPFAGSECEAINEVERLLTDSINGCMISDVPIGAFLSGGIDSSIVVALMQANSSRPVRTFSIGFHENKYNEAQHAHDIAKYLRTDHTEFYISETDAMDVVPRLPEMYDEPFADSSQIPTYLVSSLARRHVTVALSGDGGDEVFGGYNRHFIGQSIYKATRLFPGLLRRGVASAVMSVPPVKIERMTSLIRPFLPRSLRELNLGERLHKSARVLRSESVNDVYRELVSVWDDPSLLVVGGEEPVLDGVADIRVTKDMATHMMFRDYTTYLPDDNLTKVDRASMYSGLEVRVPLLDHRLVEFTWRLPMSMKVRVGSGKWVLRQVLYRHVPQKMLDRPKMGFGVPIEAWLRKGLRGWAEDLIDPRRLEREGYLRSEPVRRLWSEHQSKKNNHQNAIWCVLMFQAWLKQQDL